MAEQIIKLLYVMAAITSVSLLLSDVARINALIHLLSLVMTVGKYLPLIVAVFAFVNLTIAIMSFLVWNSLIPGAINSVFAFGGFIFLGQLLRRRNVHRYDYRYSGRHSKRLRPFVEIDENRKTSPKAGSATA